MLTIVKSRVFYCSHFEQDTEQTLSSVDDDRKMYLQVMHFMALLYFVL